MTPEELKNSILQLAIQGKLVEQRPEEGNAEDLYQKIRAYQYDNGVCKEDLNYDSMDYDIPDKWKMVDLSQLFKFVDYRGKTPTKISEGVFLITASNIKKGTMDYTRKEYISHTEYLARQSRGITSKGDLLFTTEAPMGNAAICDLDICSCGQRIITFQEHDESVVLSKLYMYFILSPQFQRQLLDNCTGTTAKGIKADKLKHFRIPLPPLLEQKRIVARIEELLPYIDRYGQAWRKVEDLNKRFPDDMKKSILQLAIQGKLVEQRPEEGTGEELYQQIQAEKQKLIKAGTIKKEKPLPDITEDEKPFEIPESWKWVRLGDIYKLLMGQSPEGKSVSEGLCGIEFHQGKVFFSENYIQKSNHVTNKPTKIAEPYSVLLCVRAPVGIVNITEREICIGRGLCAISTYANMDTMYVLYSLRSFETGFIKKATGTTFAAITGEIVRNQVVPLPPLAEQKRIVDRIEELLPLCDKLIK